MFLFVNYCSVSDRNGVSKKMITRALFCAVCCRFLHFLISSRKLPDTCIFYSCVVCLIRKFSLFIFILKLLVTTSSEKIEGLKDCDVRSETFNKKYIV